MRVSHVIPTLGTGGAESLVVGLALEMTAQGHDVEIVVLSPLQGVPYETAREQGLTVRQVGRHPRDVLSIPKLRNAIQEREVVHTHLFPALYFVPMTRTPAARVYTEHSTTNRRRDRVLFRPFDRLAYSSYESVTAISVGTSNALVAYGAKIGVSLMPEVIPNGISEEFFDVPLPIRPKVGSGALRVISIGTLDDRKNFSDALKAIAMTDSSTLTVVGDGPEREQLATLSQQLGIGDRVTFTGSRSDIVSLLDKHDVLLSTSRHEGFGLVVAEAIARGVPVIGPDVPGVNEVASQDPESVLVPQGPGFVAEAARALKRFADDRSLLHRPHQEIIARRMPFRLDRVAEAYVEVYERARSRRLAR